MVRLCVDVSRLQNERFWMRFTDLWEQQRWMELNDVPERVWDVVRLDSVLRK